MTERYIVRVVAIVSAAVVAIAAAIAVPYGIDQHLSQQTRTAQIDGCIELSPHAQRDCVAIVIGGRR